MAYTYRYLTDDDKADIAEEHRPDRPEPSVDDTLKEAWERDHYAHSLLAEQATDPDERQEHLDAMATIEAALERKP